MSYFIIIRGPAGSGKTTIAKRLAEKLDAYYLDFDSILAEHNLDTIEGDGISAENFIEGNKLILEDVKKRLEADQIVIIDACFYRKEHLGHMIKNLPYKYYIFSLKVSLGECIRRNKKRQAMTSQDIKDVFRLVSKFDVGIPIAAEGKTVDEVVSEIMNHLKD